MVVGAGSWYDCGVDDHGVLLELMSKTMTVVSWIV